MDSNVIERFSHLASKLAYVEEITVTDIVTVQEEKQDLIQVQTTETSPDDKLMLREILDVFKQCYNGNAEATAYYKDGNVNIRLYHSTSDNSEEQGTHKHQKQRGSSFSPSEFRVDS